MTLLGLLLCAASASAEPRPSAVGAVVRSKEWIVRRGASREEEFAGDVRYEAAGTRLSADWALYRHESRDWTARGDVRVSKTLEGGDVVEARGASARYDEASGGGTLLPAAEGRVAFTRTPPQGAPDRGEGRRLDWESDRAATLSGSARVWGPRLEAWADSARYERAGRTLILRGGRPVLRKVDEEGGWTTALKADEIRAVDSPRRIEASGGVRGWLIFKDEAGLRGRLR